MPNNKKIVKQCASYMKRMLQKDSSFHADYIAFMNDLVTKGYAERVPEEVHTAPWRLPSDKKMRRRSELSLIVEQVSKEHLLMLSFYKELISSVC